MPEIVKKYKWSQNNENRAINREIIDSFIKTKHCTLITNPNYICDKLQEYKLRKGKEPQCHCPEFINCPAFNQYINHEMFRGRRKFELINKSKNKKNGSRK